MSKRCRKRIWRSEIEVDPDAGNSRTTSLEERQARREGEPCKCGPQWRMDNMYGILRSNFVLFTNPCSSHDPGLSPIFSSRIQEPNYLFHDHAAKLNVIKKEPDRIHGLQSTTSLERLLQQHYDAQSQHDSEPSRRVVDLLQISGNPDGGGKRLLFPFLVMEAKSGKGGSDFDEIEIQTAHPIMNLLMLQHELQQIESNKMAVPGGPLAWFLANVGEKWRVYGCYVTSSGNASRPFWVSLLLSFIGNATDVPTEHCTSLGRQHHWP